MAGINFLHCPSSSSQCLNFAIAQYRLSEQGIVKVNFFTKHNLCGDLFFFILVFPEYIRGVHWFHILSFAPFRGVCIIFPVA
jgi:hypothetical protein